MEYNNIAHIATDFLLTTVILSLPAIIASLTIGVVISVLQTMTSIQEQTLTFAPRILAVVCVFWLMMPWMLKMISGFAMRMMYQVAQAGAV